MKGTPGVGNPLYEVIEGLCQNRGITMFRMCKDLGFRNGLLSDLKHGRSKFLSGQNIWKIARYFDVSTDILCVAAEQIGEKGKECV